MGRKMMMTLLVPGAVALAAMSIQSASAAVIPANEAWTEATGGGTSPNNWFWGSFQQGSGWSVTTGVVLDTTNKTTGNGSVEYVNYPPASPGRGQPAIVFNGTSRLDLTAYAGGQLSFDFMISDTTDYSSMNLYLYIGDATTKTSKGLGAITPQTPVVANQWTHMTITLPTTWQTGEANPIYALRFFEVFTGTPAAANQWFDNVKITAVPEPASLTLLGLGGLLLIRRRRPHA